MSSRYRLPRPDRRGRQRHVLRRSRDPHAVYPDKVIDPAGNPEDRLTIGASLMPTTGIAKTTAAGYVRGSLTFFDHHWHKLASSTAPVAYTPWGRPTEVREAFAECLRALHPEMKLTPSTTEEDVWHIDGPDEVLDEATLAICGTAHLYTAFITAGVYKDAHPFIIPKADRVTKRIPGLDGASGARFIEPRFRFRIPSRAAAALVLDAPTLVCRVVPALVAAGVPTSVVMIIKTQIEGLARISEELRLTVWDWWTASQFGAEVATPNKGDGEKRTKTQSFSPEHTADMQVWFDVDRRDLDHDGWGLDEWRAFLTDPTKTKKERREKAMRSPLFPSATKGFLKRSTVVDKWYRPAMKAAGLPTRTHFLRHAGVSSFLAHLRRREDLSPAQRKAIALQFAVDMGWKWPERMLEGYSAPERQTARIEARRTWREERQKNFDALLAGLGSIEHDSLPEPANDVARSSIMRHILEKAA